MMACYIDYKEKPRSTLFVVYDAYQVFYGNGLSMKLKECFL